MLNDNETKILNAAIRTNVVVMACAFGLVAGVALWLSTVLLLLRGGDKVGPHLSLLSVFFPGYEVTWVGAWVGLAWGFVFGAISGAVLYLGYARVLKERLAGQVLEDPASSPFIPPTFLLSGNALGAGLGILLALQLLLTTNWLVIRGTAPYSKNAALLGHYLPGYTVSLEGSLIGAAELFVTAFVASHVLAAIYNFVARMRTI